MSYSREEEDRIEIAEPGENAVPTTSQVRNCCEAREAREARARVYSVSFQENGFVFQETSPNAANQKWSQTNFNTRSGGLRAPRQRSQANDLPHSPNVPIPGINDDEVFDTDDTVGLVPDEDEEPRRAAPRYSQSLGTRGPGYNSFGTGSPSTSTPIVFCIHGNKFGVARCCDDLVPGRQELGEDATLASPKSGAADGSLPTQDISRNASSQELHCHPEQERGGIDKKARRKLIIASVLCLLFMVIEIVGGVLANSLAIATDAAHLLTDFASFMISLFSIWVASRPATRRMSFGWHRAEVIGATVSVLLIWVVTGILVYAAILRIKNQDFELDPTIMLITSGIGVGVNIIMGCALHQHGHGHSHGGGGGGHGHSHVEAVEAGAGGPVSEAAAQRAAEDARKENINVRAAFIHVLGDFIQSIGVFIAALVIYFYPAYAIIDPICTFIFSVLVLVTTIRILKDTMVVLMEGIPKDVSFSVVQETFLSVEGIVAVHNLRIWGLTTDKTALAAHLAIAPGSSPQNVLREASTKIRQRYNFYEMTLQVEEFQEDMDDCTQCQNPE